MYRLLFSAKSSGRFTGYTSFKKPRKKAEKYGDCEMYYV